VVVVAVMMMVMVVVVMVVMLVVVAMMMIVKMVVVVVVVGSYHCDVCVVRHTFSFFFMLLNSLSAAICAVITAMPKATRELTSRKLASLNAFASWIVSLLGYLQKICGVLLPWCCVVISR
jgi:hypothetical protein